MDMTSIKQAFNFECKRYFGFSCVGAIPMGVELDKLDSTDQGLVDPWEFSEGFIKWNTY